MTKTKPKTKTSSKCKTVRPLRGIGPKRQPVLVGDPCCAEGLRIFKAGFKAEKDPTVRGHLQEFHDTLKASEPKLMDYCVMVWGLREEEKDNFVQEVQQRYRLVPMK